MIDVVVGVGDVDGDAGIGEGEVVDGVRVVGVNGAGGVGSAEDVKNEDISPIIGVAWRLAMPTGCVNGTRE
jgi:hypothetical protein